MNKQKNPTDVWVFVLEQLVDYDIYCDSLSALRKQKIDRLQVDDKKNQSAAVEFALSIALKNCNVNESAQNLQYAASGKPYFESGAVELSLSHTTDAAVCALSFEGKVGVDCERIDQRKRDVLQKTLTQSEREGYDQANHKDCFLFQSWTAKESFLKMIGQSILCLKNVQIKKTDNDLLHLQLGQIEGFCRVFMLGDLVVAVTKANPFAAQVSSFAMSNFFKGE